jgi:hypothetical protein
MCQDDRLRFVPLTGFSSEKLSYIMRSDGPSVKEDPVLPTRTRGFRLVDHLRLDLLHAPAIRKVNDHLAGRDTHAHEIEELIG